ncbi:hypothetical protein BDV24DRAFT_149434 [Aspergillus arachidicola]|uniref:Uncharacterized protein n=1 Tax=Aspergillus arachidicola TaxID=656916 RepID=A0A5N6YEG5_9EURO|nr:hypothetical protein BDV24DRAFT_149434 [Aspergillus arachidicola]
MELKRSPIDQEAAHILYPPTKDEEIVNSTLLDFANALLAHHPLQNKWSLHRVPLTVTFKKASFQARTDGYLHDRKTGKIRALVEIRIQETAQMRSRRIIVSQDRHEIFLTVAVFDEAYVKYLKKPLPPNTKPSYLVMEEFGPWSIWSADHMAEMGEILLAIAMRTW